MAKGIIYMTMAKCLSNQAQALEKKKNTTNFIAGNICSTIWYSTLPLIRLLFITAYKIIVII